MAQPIYANNVAGTLAANIGPADTAILLGAGQGASFPAITGGNWYYATLVHNTLGTIERVKVTAKSADTLTVTRGQDGTSATSFTTGTLVELRMIAQMLREIDYRSAMGVANGLATLDGGLKLPDAQLSANVPLLVAGKLDISTIPNAVATDAELANYLPLAGGTITGGLNIVGSLVVDTVGTGGATLKVGNDAYLIDVNVANAMGLRGVANAAIGYLYFGNAGNYIGFNGSGMVINGSGIWTAANFDPNAKLNVVNPNVSGTLGVSSAVYTNQLQANGGANIEIGAGGGAIFLRPYGIGNGTNQGIINASGLAQFVDVQSYSDRSLKKCIKRRFARHELVDNLLLHQWKRKSDGAFGIGLIAQDVEKYGPEHVGMDPNGVRSVNYSTLNTEMILDLGARLRRVESALNLKVQ